MRRENTFKIDYSQFSVKPSIEKLYSFCRTVLGLKREEIKRLQGHRGGSCAFIKVSDLALAQKVVEEHDGKHEVDCDGKKHKLRITLEDGSVEVRVYDLPEDVSEEKVVDFLSAFGEVISIREVSWGESNESEGIPLGIWSARMTVKRNIESWVNIDGEQALVVYKGQLQTCRHCKEQAHTGIRCAQNKKLIYQKSYANVAKLAGQNNKQSTGQQPRKPVGARLVNTKPVERKSTASSPAATSSDKLPENATNPNEDTDPKPRATSEPINNVVNRSQQMQHTKSTPPSFLTLPQANIVDDLFKKPGVALRSQSKTSNGNETDDSSTSTSSKRSRGRPVGKKPRRDDEDDERGEDNPL